MSAPIIECGTPYNVTATGNIGATSRGATLIGFYVNNTSAGTIILKDGGSSGTAKSGTITPVIGFHRFPAVFPNGLGVTIGGTLDVTLILLDGQS